MNEQKDLMEVAKLWKETGWLTAVIGGPFFLWLLRRPSSWSA